MSLLTLIALFLTFDFAVIGAAHLIHALIASNNQVRDLRAAIPQGTVLDVNRQDITITGQVSTAVQALIIGLTVLSAYAVSNRSKIRPKFFIILGSLLSFTSLWLLSVTIAFTVIFATKSARVSASLRGIQLPHSIIDAQARALGVSPVYRDQSYLLYAAIFSWFTWLFTTISAVAVFLESRVSVSKGEPLNDKSTTNARRESTPSIA
jgi:hypothetical protein